MPTTEIRYIAVVELDQNRKGTILLLQPWLEIPHVMVSSRGRSSEGVGPIVAGIDVGFRLSGGRAACVAAQDVADRAGIEKGGGEEGGGEKEGCITG